MKTKVLICGATGFIGRNLTEQLSKRTDIELHASRYHHPAYDCGNNVIWHQADLRRQDDVDRVVKGMDIIIQAAATISSAKELVAKPHLHVTDNTIMNAYLFRSAFEHKTKHVVLFSSAEIYHSSEQSLSEVDFDANKQPMTAHAGFVSAKAYLEKMAEFYSSFSGTKYTAIRTANVYGPHDKYDLDRAHLFASILTRAMTAKDKIVIKGTADHQNEFLYIDDLVQAVEAAIAKQTAPYRVYNCTNQDGVTNQTLASQVIQQTGRELTVEFDQTDMTASLQPSLNCAQIADELGWKATVDIESGLRKTVAWWKENVRIKVAEPA